MSMELREKIIKMLELISSELQAKCEDNYAKAEMKDYFDTKIYNVRDYGLQYLIEHQKSTNKQQDTGSV